MRTSVRRIAASFFTSVTTRTTSSLQCTTWRRSHRRLRGAHHALSLHRARTVFHLMMTPHTSWLKFWAITLSSPCHPWRVLFDSISPFFLYWSFLPFSVFFLYPELFLELDNPIVMESLRHSAADESEDTLNSFTSRTDSGASTVLELYDLETHQKKLGPAYHRLKTMVKRSIEQEIRNRILGAEIFILRRTPWSGIREQNSVYNEFLEIVGNGKPTGSVWKETIAVSATIWISVGEVHHQIRLRILHAAEWARTIEDPKSQR